MDAALLKGIVRIEVDAKGSRGTGFVVRAEAGGVEILTALHVIADLAASRAGGTPVWLGNSAEVRFEGNQNVSVPLHNGVSHSHLAEDWAVLRVEGKVPSEIVPLRLARLEQRPFTRKWSTFGFSDAQPDTGEPHSGEIELEDKGIIHLFGKQAAAGGGGLVSGCSGAPCVFEGHVVGIVVEALKNSKHQAIHGAVFARTIQSVAEACGLPLAPGPQVFQEEVEQALADVRGSSLQKLAKALDVPHIESEDSLRIWIARALLAADERKVREALLDCAGSVHDPVSVAEMALSRAVREECAQVVRACLRGGSPRGVATIATEELTARLLVARAVEGFTLANNCFERVESRARTTKAWSTRIRETVGQLLRYAPDELPDKATLDKELCSRGRAMLAFKFDPRTSPFDEIEGYKGARALAMLSPKEATTFARDGYTFAPVLDDPEAESTIKADRERAVSWFTPKPKR